MSGKLAAGHGEQCPCDSCAYLRVQLKLLSRENRVAVVKMARAQGWNEHQIHKLTGLARGTIRRILTRLGARLMRTRIIAGLILAAALPLAAAAPAAAAGHTGVAPMARTSAAPPTVAAAPPVHPRGVHPDAPNSECLATNHNLCMTNKNGTLAAGNIISGSAQSGNSNQHWEFILSSACGDGHVHQSPACPFANGSGLNTQFNGDQIVIMRLLDHPSWCQAVNNPQVNGAITLQSCTATGTNWIIDTNGNVTGWVNKSRTDVLGNNARTTTDGTLGHSLNAFVNNFEDADAQWITLLGV
jgi:hypothetical protein